MSTNIQVLIMAHLRNSISMNGTYQEDFPMFNAETVTDGLIQWIRDYFDENGRDCRAVIGLSGGKDSSVAAALCVRALGVERVFGVLMPQGEQKDINTAKELAAHLGIEHCIVNIKDAVDALLESLKQGGLDSNRQVKINTPARLRMTVLYAAAAIVNGRVVNTCNLSEDWVGYATKFGDGAGDFSPLSHLTVTEVKAVGRELGLPSAYTEKMPEDGLSGLSDEENLGFTYAVLDRYIREGICEDKETKEKIDKLHKNNLHKLELMPSYGYQG
jgi:NAD+ synthase